MEKSGSWPTSQGTPFSEGKLLVLNNLNGASMGNPLIWVLNGSHRDPERRNWIVRKAAIGWPSQGWLKTVLKIKKVSTLTGQLVI